MITGMMKEKVSFYLHFDIQVGERILCRHPFNESKRAYVVPQRVEELMKCFWSGSPGTLSGFAIIFGNRTIAEHVALSNPLPFYFCIIVVMT